MTDIGTLSTGVTQLASLWRDARDRVCPWPCPGAQTETGTAQFPHHTRDKHHSRRRNAAGQEIWKPQCVWSFAVLPSFPQTEPSEHLTGAGVGKRKRIGDETAEHLQQSQTSPAAACTHISETSMPGKLMPACRSWCWLIWRGDLFLHTSWLRI